jgi:hypothetical protein
MQGDAASDTRNKLAIIFQVALLEFCRCMNVISSNFFRHRRCFLPKTWPKKKNPTARKVLAVGF